MHCHNVSIVPGCWLCCKLCPASDSRLFSWIGARSQFEHGKSDQIILLAGNLSQDRLFWWLLISHSFTIDRKQSQRFCVSSVSSLLYSLRLSLWSLTGKLRRGAYSTPPGQSRLSLLWYWPFYSTQKRTSFALQSLSTVVYSSKALPRRCKSMKTGKKSPAVKHYRKHRINLHGLAIWSFGDSLAAAGRPCGHAIRRSWAASWTHWSSG